MKAIILGITLALASTSAMAWKGMHTTPAYTPPTQTVIHSGSAPSIHPSPLMSMDVMPHVGIQICSTPVVYSEDRRCNGFRVGEHCLAPVVRAELDLLPPPPPAVVPAPAPTPVAPVKPENG